MKVVLLARVAPDAAIETAHLVNALHDPSSATTLRRHGAELVLTDGPFAESPEPVAGLDEIDVPDLTTAIRLAARRPAAAIGAIEVRAAENVVDDVPPAVPVAGTRRYLFLHVLPTAPAAGPAAPANGSLAQWLASPLTRRTVTAGNRLTDATPSTAATVRVRNGETLVEHGLEAGRREEIAGYDLVSARDLDEAIDVARPHPTLATGAVEIRPLVMA